MTPEPLSIHAEPESKRPPIDWRTGAYASYLAAMIAAAKTQTVVVESPGGAPRPVRPLASLNTALNENFAMGLLQCWATVCEILSFYSERILNEGYLATAQERRSLIELTRLLGYQVRPGVGANVWINFQVADTPGMPSDPVIPKGTRIQSVPGQGMAPQIFETSEDTVVRSEWTETPTPPPNRPRGILKPGDKVDGAAITSPEIHVAGTRTGLLPGDSILLIPGPAACPTLPDPYPADWFVTLLDVQPKPEAGFTRLILQAPPTGDPATTWQPGAFRMVAFRRTAPLFGHNAPDWLALTDERKLASGGTAIGGITGYIPAADSFPAKDLTRGLPPGNKGEAPARMLLSTSWGDLFAATASGVFRRRGPLSSPDAGWEAVTNGLTTLNIYSLAEINGFVFSGGMGAVFRSADRGETWDSITPSAPITVTQTAGTAPVLAVYTAAGPVSPSGAVRFLVGVDAALVVGSDLGAWILRSPSGNWEMLTVPGDNSLQKSPAPVTALVAGPDRSLFLATGADVFYSADITQNSLATTRFGIPGPFLLAPCRRGAVLTVAAASGSQIRCWSGSSWETSGVETPASSPENTPAKFLSLSRCPDDSLLAATTAGIFRLGAHESKWVRIAQDADAVSAFQLPITGAVVANRLYGGVLQTDWPNSNWSQARAGGDLDLDALDDRIGPDSWVLVRGPVANSHPALTLLKVAGVTTAVRSDFWMNGEVTRIATPQPWSSTQAFPVRGTTVFLQSEEMREVSQPVQPVASGPDSRAPLSLAVPWRKLPHPGRTVFVTGKRLNSTPETAETPVFLKGTVVSPPSGPLPPAGPPSITIQLDPRTAVRPKPAIALPVSPTPVVAGGAVEVDPSSLKVLMNVVTATQGETVRDEIVGSGDASLAWQSFPLRRSPLAFVNPETTGEPQWTLTVSVNGVTWRRVASFNGLGPGDEAYVVDLNYEGRATIRFGDGVSGARLPSGNDNITATYRVAVPDQGQITAGTVVNLLDRPLGIRAVSGLSPSGMTQVRHGAETREEIVSRASRFGRALQRPVSLRDYEDFATFQPGIGKALARRTRQYGRVGIHLTVASRYFPETPDPDSLLPLVTAIRDCEVVPALLAVTPYQPHPFRLSARIRLAAGTDWAALSDLVRATLLSRFGYERRDLDQPLTQSDVLKTIAGVEGVAGAAVTELYPELASASLEERLPPPAGDTASIIFLRDVKSISLSQWDGGTEAAR